MNQSKILEKYILDPLSVIIKLAILAKKPIGSKITIDSNIIYIQEIGIFQGFVRFVYKINKDQIQYLYNPIELASCKFLSDSYIKQYPKLKNLFKNAIKGIEKLIETYKQNIIFTHSLFMYESLIYNNLSGNSLKDLTDPDYNPFLFKSDSISDEYTKEIIDNFILVWTDERIKLVLNMIDFIDQDIGYEQSVKCLEDLMNIIDKEIQIKVNLYNEIIINQQLNKEHPNILENNTTPVNTTATVIETNITPVNTITETNITPINTITETNITSVTATITETNITPLTSTITETNITPINTTITETNIIPLSSTITETNIIPLSSTIIKNSIESNNTKTEINDQNDSNIIKTELNKSENRKQNKSKLIDTNKFKLNDLVIQEQNKEKTNELPIYAKYGSNNLIGSQFGIVRTQPTKIVETNNNSKNTNFNIANMINK
jgi:hypothetical protein